MRIEHCPTGEMTGDFFTKPLQGAAFRKFRHRILYLSEQDLKHYLLIGTAACFGRKTNASQECVGEYQSDKGQMFLNLAMEGSYVARKKAKMEDEREMLI